MNELGNNYRPVMVNGTLNDSWHLISNLAVPEENLFCGVAEEGMALVHYPCSAPRSVLIME